MASCSQSKQLFDPIRRCFVPATGEERVRQWLILKMVEELHYPTAFLAVEKEIKELSGLEEDCFPKRRIDLVCFSKAKKGLSPLLLIECKDTSCLKEALLQVMGYNHFIRAPFIAVVGKKKTQIQSLVAYWDTSLNKYLFKGGIPSYDDLIDPQFPLSFQTEIS